MRMTSSPVRPFSTPRPIPTPRCCWRMRAIPLCTKLLLLNSSLELEKAEPLLARVLLMKLLDTSLGQSEGLLVVGMLLGVASFKEWW